MTENASFIKISPILGDLEMTGCFTNIYKFVESVVYTTFCGLNRQPYEEINQITATCVQELKADKEHEHHHREIGKWAIRHCQARYCRILNQETGNHDSFELRILRSHLSRLVPNSTYAWQLQREMQVTKKNIHQLIFSQEDAVNKNCAMCKLGKERALRQKEVTQETDLAFHNLLSQPRAMQV